MYHNRNQRIYKENSKNEAPYAEGEWESYVKIQHAVQIKKEKFIETKKRTVFARLTGGHADHSSTTLVGVEYKHTQKNKPWFFQGWYRVSLPHICYGCDTTAPELHRGPKVLSVHSVRKLNSSPPYSYCQGNDFSGPTTWLPRLMGTFKGPSNSRYKIKSSRETFGYFGKERRFFARA